MQRSWLQLTLIVALMFGAGARAVAEEGKAVEGLYHLGAVMDPMHRDLSLKQLESLGDVETDPSQVRGKVIIHTSGGAAFGPIECPDGYVVTGITVRAGDVIDQFANLRCKQINTLQNPDSKVVTVAVHAGGNGGSEVRLDAPVGQAFAAFKYKDAGWAVCGSGCDSVWYYDDYQVYRVVGKMIAVGKPVELFTDAGFQMSPDGIPDESKLWLSATVGGSGNVGNLPWTGSYCPAGSLMTGVQGRAGSLLDHAQPVCRTVQTIETKGCIVIDPFTKAIDDRFTPVMVPKETIDLFPGASFASWDTVMGAIDSGACNHADADGKIVTTVRIASRLGWRLDAPVHLAPPAGSTKLEILPAGDNHIVLQPASTFQPGAESCAVTLNGNVAWQPYFYSVDLRASEGAYWKGAWEMRDFPITPLCLKGDNNHVEQLHITGVGAAPCTNTDSIPGLFVAGSDNRIIDGRIDALYGRGVCGHGIVLQSGINNQVVRTPIIVENKWQPLVTSANANAGLAAPQQLQLTAVVGKTDTYRLQGIVDPSVRKIEVYFARTPDANAPEYFSYFDDHHDAGRYCSTLLPPYGAIDREIPIPESIRADYPYVAVTAHRQATATCGQEDRIAGSSSPFSHALYIPFDANGNGAVDGPCEGAPEDSGCVDTDHDALIDAMDNCPQKANADQADDDKDGTGNVCDKTPCAFGYALNGTNQQCEALHCSYGMNAEGTACLSEPIDLCADHPGWQEKTPGVCCNPDAPTDHPESCGYVPPAKDTGTGCPEGQEPDPTQNGACVASPAKSANQNCPDGQDPDPTNPGTCKDRPKDNVTAGIDCSAIGKVMDAATQTCVDAAPATGDQTNTAVIPDTTNTISGASADDPAGKKDEPQCESGLWMTCGQATPEKKGWCSLVPDAAPGPDDAVPWILFGTCVSVLTLYRLRSSEEPKCVKRGGHHRRRARGQRGCVATRKRRRARRPVRNAARKKNRRASHGSVRRARLQ